MIEEIILRKQTPTAPNEWLYEDNQDGRFFCKEVYLGKHAEPWAECTEAEKLAWEEAHTEVEPTEIAEEGLGV